MFKNPRRGRQARNFTTNAAKILDLKSSSEQIFSRKLSLGAPETIRTIQKDCIRHWRHKANQTIGSPDILHYIYNAFLVQPHFDYCSIVWGNCGETLSEKLQKLQNRAARILTGRYTITFPYLRKKNAPWLNEMSF